MKSSASVRAQEIQRLAGLQKMCDRFATDCEKLEQFKLSRDDYETAAGYVFCLPLWTEVLYAATVFSPTTGAEKTEHLHKAETVKRLLDNAHAAAVRWLMELAELMKMDSSVLWSDGVICRDLFRAGPIYGNDRANDLWPDCLGEKKLDLPDRSQAAIDAADALRTRIFIVARRDKHYSSIAAAGSRRPAAKKKRGRPPDTDRKQDLRWQNAWKSGLYRTFAECAAALGVNTSTIKNACERVRKRQRRTNSAN